MSFRSRPRTTQPSTVPRRRTSLSSSRAPSSTPSYYNGSTPGYSSTTRPLSTGFYTGSQGSVYQSPYAHIYGSRDSLYNHSNRNGYYTNGMMMNPRRQNISKQSSSNFKSLGFYDPRYNTNSYGSSDRYISPYSSFDNGVTTAGLNLSMMTGKGYQSPKSSSYSNKSKNNSKYIDYNSGRNTNLLKSKSLSTSNTSLNSYPSAASTKISVGTNTPAIVTRSNSLRDQEMRSRSRTRNKNPSVRSLSASSEKSEGYESGSEKTVRSRVGSTTSLNDTEQDKNSSKDTENGEVIDYKALWEASQLENDKLRKELKKKDDELANAKAAVERVTNVAQKNSLSELEKRERRAMERKLSEMEEELKHLDILKSENQRLKEENGALIRVISKLSK